ncbi:hypothetical protein M1563_02675 [Patescibacteria group bacterium]|nr:hypothetical protein [Patescibacteria group bacterium]MCL5409941.1 hypothetical protein [Patescibacteria group bacterium]
MVFTAQNKHQKYLEQGVSVIELVLVTVIIAALALLVANLPSSVSSINRSRHSSIAKDIATRELEYLRKLSYDSLSNGTNNFTDPDLTSLPKSTASYTVNDCQEPACINGEKAKIVTVSVAWNESGDDKTVDLSTIVSQGGLAQ